MSVFLANARQAFKLFSAANAKNFDGLAHKLDLVEASETGKFKFQMTVDESNTNVIGTLHGAYIAFLVDHTTSVSLALSGRGPMHAGMYIISFIFRLPKYLF